MDSEHIKSFVTLVVTIIYASVRYSAVIPFELFPMKHINAIIGLPHLIFFPELLSAMFSELLLSLRLLNLQSFLKRSLINSVVNEPEQLYSLFLLLRSLYQCISLLLLSPRRISQLLYPSYGKDYLEQPIRASNSRC
jgi:hypothetical protein